MLIDLDGNEIKYVPYQDQFDLRNRRLTPDEQHAIEEEINRRVDEQETDEGLIFCSSFIAGSDWSGTPFQRLYEICGEDEEVAKLFYGQWCWFTLMNRPDRFRFERIEHLGPDRICGLTYWRSDN